MQGSCGHRVQPTGNPGQFRPADDALRSCHIAYLPVSNHGCDAPPNTIMPACLLIFSASRVSWLRLTPVRFYYQKYYAVLVIALPACQTTLRAVPVSANYLNLICKERQYYTVLLYTAWSSFLRERPCGPVIVLPAPPVFQQARAQRRVLRKVTGSSSPRPVVLGVIGLACLLSRLNGVFLLYDSSIACRSGFSASTAARFRSAPHGWCSPLLEVVAVIVLPACSAG
ncbi:unnamed protein product, partial [Brenthis ino]